MNNGMSNSGMMNNGMANNGMMNNNQQMMMMQQQQQQQQSNMQNSFGMQAPKTNPMNVNIMQPMNNNITTSFGSSAGGQQETKKDPFGDFGF